MRFGVPVAMGGAGRDMGWTGRRLAGDNAAETFAKPPDVDAVQGVAAQRVQT